MPIRKAPSSIQTRELVEAVGQWIVDDSASEPDRASVAAAVRATALTVEHLAPGRAVEIRIPPFVAVQCIGGPQHSRGTPPNVVETNARTWLRIVTGEISLHAASVKGLLSASGTRAGEVAAYFPLVRLQPPEVDAS